MASKDQTVSPDTISFIAHEVQDDLHSNKKAEALVKAHEGGMRIQRNVRATSRKATEQVVIESGATPSVAKEIVTEAVKKPKVLPHALISTLLSRTQAARRILTPEAVTANETSRWIDDVNVADKKSFAGSTELLNDAISSGDAFTCLLRALQVSRRGVRSEQVLATAFYAISDDFERDRRAFRNGRSDGDVKTYFDLLEKVLNGSADSEEAETFRSALISRVEEVNGMEKDDLLRLNRHGPDAMVWSKTEDGRPLLLVGYMSNQDDAEKPILTAHSIEKHLPDLLRDLPEGAEVMVVVAGSSLVAESARMKGENRNLDTWADDVAVVRAASTIFEVMDSNIIPEMLRGRLKFSGWFAASDPFVLGKDFADPVKEAVDSLMSRGYPSGTGRGIEIMTQSLNVLTNWASRHPESYPYFQNQKTMDWVRGCPIMKDGVASIKTNAIRALRQDRETAILDAEMDREQRNEEILRDRKAKQVTTPTSTPTPNKAVEELKQLVLATIVGEGRRFKSLQGTSGIYLMAFINEGDSASVKKIIEGANPRALRLEVLEARAAVAFDGPDEPAEQQPAAKKRAKNR